MRAAGTAVLLLFAVPAAAQPALSYDSPAGWTRGPYSLPVVYTAPGGDAELHVYDFQRFAGDVRQRFQQTRLFELIGIEHRESGTLEPPKFAEIQVQGAGTSSLATFVAPRGGVNRLYLRVAIPSSGAVAIVDFSVRSQEAWTRYVPEVDRVFSSMRVGDASAPVTTPPPRPGQGVGGLYLATIRRLAFRPSLSGGSGSTEWTTSTEYYLLAPDGKLHHGYGLPEAPGGDIRRFDYDKARRSEPGNSGSYTVIGNRVTIVVGQDKTTARLLSADEIEIRGTKYKRSGR